MFGRELNGQNFGRAYSAKSQGIQAHKQATGLVCDAHTLLDTDVGESIQFR